MPAALAPRIEREIRALAPDLPIQDLRTMNQSMSGIIGVYGVVSFGASLRTKEIGIRVALGAQPRDVLRLILGQGLLLVAIGVMIGLAASMALGRVLSRFLP